MLDEGVSDTFAVEHIYWKKFLESWKKSLKIEFCCYYLLPTNRIWAKKNPEKIFFHVEINFSC